MGHDFPDTGFLRLADAVTNSLVDVPDEKELAKRLKGADRLIPPSIWLKLRKAFTPKGLPFFQFYIELNRIRLGGPVPKGLKQIYKRAADRVSMVRSPVDKRTISPAMTNHIALTRPLIGRVLGAVEQGRVDDPIQWAKLNAVMVPLLVDIAKDKGVYMKATRQMGRERWATFRKMSPKQERVEKLRDDDPESFALMEKLGQTLAQIDGNIVLRIEAAGHEVKKGFLAGRPVLIGVDPATGEEMVYDRDGEVVPKGDFFAKVRAKTEAMSRLVRVPSRTVVPPKQLRMLDDEHLEGLTGDLTWDAITDDKAKQGKLTRLFPTKRMRRFISDPETGETRVEEYKVVVEGRYKGIFLDDLVNSEGRLIEGTVYTYDVKKGREAKFPKVIDPSEREPYVTVADVITKRQFQGKKIKVKTKKLYIKIDGTRQNKVLRNALKALACNAGTKRGCIPSISYEAVKGSRAAGFYFDPKDFGVIMDSLQGMSLSKSALAEVKSYYKDLARAEEATKNLDAYEPDALASENEAGEKFQFITGSHGKNGEWEPFSLREKQKEALAWMDANGNSGVCALETGVGKTAVSIAMMLKLVRDGLAEPDATYTRPDGVDVTTNGRFLFVCPTSLRGNIKKEIRGMLSDEKVMLARLDVLTYGQFSGASKTGTVPRQLKSIPFWKERIGAKGKRAGFSKAGKAYKSKKAWDPALYAALIFDEAQAMKNPDSQRSQWALKLHHPRKICLTASPMERNPMEAYVLAAITNNTPLFGRSIEAKNNRKEMRRFKERFCEVVGGRIVGIKQDPLVQRDLHTFIKRNVFHADKTEVKEYNLPKPTVTATPVEMPPMVESMYRDVTKQFAVIMEGAARKFRERKKTDNYGDKQAERIFSMALKPIIRLLTDMANRPAKAMRDVAFAIENGYLPDFVKPIKPDGSGGEPRPLPKAFMGLLRQWQDEFTPGDIEAMADTIGNPKIESAEATIAAKLERAKGSRALIFADDRELCLEAGMHMAKTMAGTHVVALNDRIHFFRAGSELEQLVYPLDTTLMERLVKDPDEQKAIKAKTSGLSVHKLPFGKKALKMHPALPGKQGVHQPYLADDWQQFVLKEIVNPDSSIATCTLLGKTYMYGHNLQSFNTVIHLDRDSWNSESMKQRTARAWRQGQDEVVDEVTLDFTYAGDKEGVPTNPNDQTLDQIRKSFQEMDGAIFDSIIKDAQGIELGAEWEGVKKRDASLWRLDEKVVDLMLSPMLERV
jgi:hypothetical protein